MNMYSLLGKTGVNAEKLQSKLNSAQKQIETLYSRIKAKKESLDEQVMSKFADHWEKQLEFESKHSDEKNVSDQPPTMSFPSQTRPKKEHFNKIKANFYLRKTLKGHNNKIYAMQWSSDSSSIVSASQDGTLLVWNMEPGNYKKNLCIPLRMAWVLACGYSPNSEFVASGGLDNLCTIYNIKDRCGWDPSTPHRSLQQHEGYISCCQFVNDNQILTSSGDATCVLWDIEYQHPIQVFSGHDGDVSSVAVNAKTQQQFVSGSIDCTGKLWDLRVEAKGRSVSTFCGHQSDINCVKWFPDCKSFATASDDGCCRLFDLGSHQAINVYGDDDEQCYGVTWIDFSKSGYYLAASYDEGPECNIWNTVHARKEAQLEHGSRVSCVEFAPNGSCLATGSWDFNMRLWA